MPKSFEHIRLWTDFNENFYDLKYHIYVMEKFSDFFTLWPSDLITTLTYVLMNNFCPCFHCIFRNFKYVWFFIYLAAWHWTFLFAIFLGVKLYFYITIIWVEIILKMLLSRFKQQAFKWLRFQRHTTFNCMYFFSFKNQCMCENMFNWIY